jgi:hypothetical protein
VISLQAFVRSHDLVRKVCNFSGSCSKPERILCHGGADGNAWARAPGVASRAVATGQEQSADLAKLNQVIKAGLADPTIRARLAELGSVPMPLSPAAFDAPVAAATGKSAKAVKAADAKAE